MIPCNCKHYISGVTKREACKGRAAVKRCVAIVFLAALVLLAGCDRKPVSAGGSSEPATAPVSTPLATAPPQKTKSTGSGEGTQAPSVYAPPPEATQDTVAGQVPIRMVGFWDGVLVVSYPQYLPDGTCRSNYVALRDGEIAGMLVQVEDSFTFYDSQLQVIGTGDSYVGKLASNSGLVFARQG